MTLKRQLMSLSLQALTGTVALTMLSAHAQIKDGAPTSTLTAPGVLNTGPLNREIANAAGVPPPTPGAPALPGLNAPPPQPQPPQPPQNLAAQPPANGAPAAGAAPVQQTYKIKPLIIRGDSPPMGSSPMGVSNDLMPGMGRSMPGAGFPPGGQPGFPPGMESPGMFPPNGQNPGMPGLGGPGQGSQQTQNPFVPRVRPATPNPINSPAGMAPDAVPGGGLGVAVQQSGPRPVAAAPVHEKKRKVVKPHINLECTSPEIKTQGNFIGLIQNKYVYKFKDQYCFDIEP